MQRSPEREIVMAEKPNARVNFHYKRTSNYRVQYISGLRSGVTPQGKVFFDFFVERPLSPEVDTFEVSQSGQLGAPIPPKIAEDSQFERLIESGIIFDIDTARAIKTALEASIANADKIKKGLN
jgi:hypothetical protein